MRDLSYYDTLSELNDALYTVPKEFKGWKLVEQCDDPKMIIAIYSNGTDTIFAIQGTKWYEPTDVKSDLQMKVMKSIPNQYRHAEKYYNEIKGKYPNLIFTGYSLGGSIAQMLGAKYGNETICFEPYGTADLQSPNHTDNLINFGNDYDIVFMDNFENQVGEIFILPVKSKTKMCDLGTHAPGFHGLPSNGNKLTQDKLDYKNSRVYLTNIVDSKVQQVKTTVNQKVNNTTNTIKTTAKQAKDYIKTGIIPTAQDHINRLAKDLNTAKTKLKPSK